MYFRRVIIKNILCHKYRDIQLKRGLIGVFGRNGAGKSTLLNLMYALLTNDFTRFPGTRANCINNTSDEKEESYVYGEVVHGEHVLKIRRGLRRPAKSELQVDDGEPITDANKIKERIEEILNLNSNMLDLFVFKQQDKIYDIFVATDGTRKEAFQTLNRTEKCAKIYDKLGEYLAKDKAAMDGFVDNSDDILQSKASVQAAVKELRAAMTAEEELLLNEASYESAHKILDAWKQKRTWETELDTLREELPEQREAMEQADDREKEQQKKVTALVAEVTRLKPKADSAGAAIAAWSQYDKQRKRLNTLTVEATNLREEYAEEKQPTEPKGFKKFDLDKAREQLQEYRAALKTARAMLSQYDATGVSKCQECGTVLERADETLLKKNRKIVEEYPAMVTELGDKISEATQYLTDCQTYAEWFAGYKQRVAANEEAIKALGELKIPEGDKETLQKLIEDRDTAEEDLEKARTKLTERTNAAATARATWESTKKSIASLRERLEKLIVTEEKWTRAKTRLQEHDDAKQKIAEIRGELKTKEARLAELKEELEQIEHKARRFQKTRDLLRIYNRAREVTHRDGLPTRVSQTNLTRLEGYVNDELEQFGNPYWIETGEDLQFIVHKPGEPPQAAPWLSTGQKCVLAASFWMTLVSVWTDGGLLCLDEPTANLDEDNRRFLADSLARLTGRIRGNRQVIMVSHDHELRSSFDQVVDLSPEEDHVAQAG